MNKLSLNSIKNIAALLLISTAAAGCASQSQLLAAPDLPPPPKPQAPSSLMKKLPQPSAYLEMLNEVFSNLPPVPTK